MKKALLTASAAAVVAACVSNADDLKSVGMANPASEFCVKQGGRLEMKQDAAGNEYALCHLPDGNVVEEWEYFRSQNSK